MPNSRPTRTPDAVDPGAAATPRAGEIPGAAPPTALYLHVPFCVSLCPYCDFVVVAGAAARGPRNRLAVFEAGLRAELALRADALDAAFGAPGAPGRPALRSVYLGGGTPTLVPTAAVAGILELVRDRYGLAPGAEVTIEANPGPDERGDLAGLVAAGVTRISLGAQALDAAHLRRIGRRHGPGDVAAAVAEARAAGIASLSVDLLHDLPDLSLAAWRATVEGVVALGVDHVSAYALTLDDPDAEGITGPLGDHLPTRPGARRWRERAIPRQSDERAAEQYELADDLLRAAGFPWYELANWARPGHESRHNLAYWTRTPHEAVGPGAHAFDGAVRRWNAARLEPWLAALVPGPGGSPRLPPGGAEPVAPAAAAVEATVLGLRLARGLPRHAAIRGPLGPHLGWGIAAGLLELADGEAGPVVRLTRRGRLLANELFVRLV